MIKNAETLPLRFRFLLLLLAPLLFACGDSAPKPSPRISSLVLEPCHLSAPGFAGRLEAECGILEVLEDRSSPGGPSISLKVAVLRAIHRKPEPDPLFFLAGGPGQAATESFVGIAGALAGVRQKRDIVLVDQRGTGSSNPLDCPEEEGLGSLDVPSLEELEESLRDCLANLSGDPRFYTTTIAMQDLDAVREAMGYDRINIYGVSYGTRAALTYLQSFPQRVRAMVLDGVVPQDLALGMTWARDAQRSFDLMVGRCAEDPACGERFPKLAESLPGLLEWLEEEPVRLTLDHPVSGQPMDVELAAETLAVIVQRFSYVPQTVALLPLLLHDAYESRDLRRLAAQAVIAEQIGGNMATGMSNSVLCSEDEPFFDGEEAARLSEGTYLADLQTELLKLICSIWPRNEAPAGFKAAVVSAVPALLLSGEADPVTPPEYGDRVAATLSRSRHWVAPGIGHNVLPHGCVADLVEEFIEAGAAEDLDPSCIADIEPSPFFLSPAGPTP